MELVNGMRSPLIRVKICHVGQRCDVEIKIERAKVRRGR